MPTFAGYYVAPDDWVDWLRPRCPQYSLDPGMAEVLIQEAINEKKFGKYLAVIMVTSPESVPGRFKQGMMVYRVSSDKRVYIHPRADSKIDLNGSRGLERLFGLKTSEWRSYWYNPNSLEMPYEAEFLEPTPLKANRKPKRTRKTRKSKKEVDSHQNGRAHVKLKDGERTRWILIAGILFGLHNPATRFCAVAAAVVVTYWLMA